MFMKRKIKSAKGFTLAELLIVVAIIAVLVAIGIPIFTSQLEKSREAVDLSDVRSAYAEVMMAAITGDTTAYYTKDTNQTIYKTNTENSKGYEIEAGAYSITVTPLKQKQPNWQTAEPITIGGVSSKAGEPYWKGQPGPDGFCVITYHPPVSGRDEYVSFYWEGGGQDSDKNEDKNDTDTDNKGDSNNSGTEDGSTDTVIKDLNSGAIQYPNQPSKSEPNNTFYVKMGTVYKKNGVLYVAVTDGSYFNHWNYAAPDNDTGGSWFVPPSGTIFSKKDLNANSELDRVEAGDIYKDGDDYYICKTLSVPYEPPHSGNVDGSGNWIKIKTKGLVDYQ